MLTKKIELRGGTITLKRAKIRDRLLMNVIIGKLGFDSENTDGFAGMRLFARLVTQAQIDGDLGFVLPALADNEEVMRESYEQFLELDGFYFDEIEQGFEEVDRPFNDPDLLPAELVPEKNDEAAE